jgi:holo-[acyl-carrier protein] synthase
MEIRNSVSGQPRVLVCGGAKETALVRGIGDIFVSISHCRTYATAYALAVGPGAPSTKANGAPAEPESNPE